MKPSYEIELRDDDERPDERQVLVIRRNGKIIREHYDHGEPEDNSFCRDWGWVVGALRAAYAFGVSDAAPGPVSGPDSVTNVKGKER